MCLSVMCYVLCWVTCNVVLWHALIVGMSWGFLFLICFLFVLVVFVFVCCAYVVMCLCGYVCVVCVLRVWLCLFVCLFVSC